MLNATRLVPATLLLIELACAGCQHDAAQSRAAAVCPSVAVAEVASSRDGGSPVPTTDGRVVFVVDPAIVATRDLVGARLGQAEGRQVLELALDRAAAARLRAYSASHVGAPLAFVVDGRVRQVMRILDPIVGDGLMVDPGDPYEVIARALGEGRCSYNR